MIRRTLPYQSLYAENVRGRPDKGIKGKKEGKSPQVKRDHERTKRKNYTQTIAKAMHQY